MQINSTELAQRLNDKIKVLGEKCKELPLSERSGYTLALVDILQLLSEELLTL